MPILSAAMAPSRPMHDAFVPATKKKDADVPDYGLEFDIIDGDYKGDQFAFDRCTDPSLLMPKKSVSEDFLNCRYERLFRYKPNVALPLYYLVPWMGIPAIKDNLGQWTLPSNNSSFQLIIRCARCTNELSASPANAKKRDLRLVPSNPLTKAVWLKLPQAAADRKTQHFDDITAFPEQSIQIDIKDGAHSETAEDIQIQEVNSDQTLGKTVGKVRLLFLDILTQKAILINVTDDGTDDDGTNFVFKRILQAADIPLALESDDDGVNHTNVLRDANVYGFNQIGINVEMEANSIDPYVTDGSVDVSMFSDPSGLPKSFKIKKTDIVGAANTVTTKVEQQTLLKAFTNKIKYVQDKISKKKFSKFSRFYIFFTAFKLPPTAGLSVVTDTDTTTETRSKLSLSYSSSIPPNVSLFRWSLNVPDGESQAHSETLTHEGAHALLVKHYFDVKNVKTIPPSDTDPGGQYDYWNAFTYANILFNIWLRKDPIRRGMDMITNYDVNKITLVDFETAATRTLFDDIIDQGFEAAIESFIDKRIFRPPNSRPAAWRDTRRKNAVTDLLLSDLLVWISLNDLVKFVKNKTGNVMDYPAGPLTTNTAVTTNTPNQTKYVERLYVHFNRFQWELARKTVSRLNELVYNP